MKLYILFLLILIFIKKNSGTKRKKTTYKYGSREKLETPVKTKKTEEPKIGAISGPRNEMISPKLAKCIQRQLKLIPEQTKKKQKQKEEPDTGDTENGPYRLVITGPPPTSKKQDNLGAQKTDSNAKSDEESNTGSPVKAPKRDSNIDIPDNAKSDQDNENDNMGTEYDDDVNSESDDGEVNDENSENVSSSEKSESSELESEYDDVHGTECDDPLSTGPESGLDTECDDTTAPTTTIEEHDSDDIGTERDDYGDGDEGYGGENHKPRPKPMPQNVVPNGESDAPPTETNPVKVNPGITTGQSFISHPTTDGPSEQKPPQPTPPLEPPTTTTEKKPADDIISPKVTDDKSAASLPADLKGKTADLTPQAGSILPSITSLVTNIPASDETQEEIDEQKQVLAVLQKVLLYLAGVTTLAIMLYSVYYVNLIRRIYAKKVPGCKKRKTSSQELNAL